MPINTKCPTCKRTLEIPDELMGKKVRCPSCKVVFLATADGSPAKTDSSRPQPPKSKSEEGIRVRRRPAPTDEEEEEEDEEEEEIPRVRKKGVRRREEDDEDEEEEDEEEESPRVRRKAVRRQDEEEDEDEEEEVPPRRRRKPASSPRRRALSAVLAPAIGLITVGALGLVLGIALLGIKLAGRSLLGLMDKEDEGTAQGMWLVMWLLSQAITIRGSVIAISWGVSVLAGGIQMKNLTHYKTVLAACILAMLPG